MKATAAGRVNQLAPAAVHLASRLGASGEESLGVHRGVLGAVARRGVQLAPADVEHLEDRVGMRFTAWAVGAGKGRTLGQMIRHGPSRGAIAVARIGSNTNALAFAICWPL